MAPDTAPLVAALGAAVLVLAVAFLAAVALVALRPSSSWLVTAATSAGATAGCLALLRLVDPDVALLPAALLSALPAAYAACRRRLHPAGAVLWAAC